jgi:anti-sigma regulatory factor (Ser/Thr protein kinase)
MLQISFNQGIGPHEVKLIREKVQAECIARKMPPKNGFVLLFVVDELSCNIMEHARASWMDLKIEADEKKFSAVLRDDGIPFDAEAEAGEAKERPVTGESDGRRLGLGLIGRLVDRISYSRENGVNQVVLEKAWQAAA